MSYYDRITKAGLFYAAVFVLTLGSFVLLMEMIPDSSFDLILLLRNTYLDSSINPVLILKELGYMTDSSFTLIILYTFTFGLFSTIFSLFIFRALFKSFKIGVGDGKFVYISPDLKVTAIEGHTEVKEAPEYGTCSYCGKEVYRPFICSDCDQLVCGKHALPGDHECQGKASNQNI